MRWVPLLLALGVIVGCSGPSAGSTPTATPSAVAAKGPMARGYHNVIGLGSSPGVLLYGGETTSPRAGGHLLGDVWVWRSGSGWSERSGLGQKDGFVFYEPKAGKVMDLVFDAGKFEPLSERWTYDPMSDSWQEQTLDKRPDFPNGAVAAFDSESNRLIVFGDGTWSYDPVANSWQQMQPKVSPAFGTWSVFVYDARADRVVLLGGENRGNLSDVWTYDFNHDTWTESVASSGPSARMYAAAAYDPRSGHVILFGGLASDSPVNDTWSYDLASNSWTHLTPKTSPPKRGRHAMAYERESGKIVMFGGGTSPLDFQRDTWTYDPAQNEWSRS